MWYLLPVALAKYAPMPVSAMMVHADVIVAGEIATVSEETFTVSVATGFVGAAAGDTLEVARFRDWPCASRWEPYAAGQSVFLMLSTDDAGGLRILSAGGEGESPARGGNLYLRGHGLPGEAEPLVEGSWRTGVPAGTDAVAASVAALRRCYAPVGDDWSLHRQCSDRVRDSYIVEGGLVGALLSQAP